MKKLLLSCACLLGMGAIANAADYQIITAADDLTPGEYLIVSQNQHEADSKTTIESDYWAMSAYNSSSKIFGAKAVNVVDGKISNPEEVVTVTIAKVGDNYTISTEGGYFQLTGGKSNNKINLVEAADDNSYFTISKAAEGDGWEIVSTVAKNDKDAAYSVQFNPNKQKDKDSGENYYNPRFSAYASAQQLCCLYKAVPAADCYVAINYQGTDWAWTDSEGNYLEEVKANADGIATLTVTDLGEWFRLRLWNGTKDLYYIKGKIEEAGVATVIEPADADDSWGSNQVIPTVLRQGEVTITLNVNTNEITITGGEKPVIAVPEALYVLGNIAEAGTWSPTNYVEMTKDGNVFTAKKVVLLGADGGETAYFGFASVVGGTWDETNAAPRYGAVEKDVPVTVATPVEFTVGDNSWAVAPGTYRMVVDFDSNTVTLTDATGVEAIVAETAPVEYFNLQGVRVANPNNGIFIRRQGNTITKVVK